MYIQDYQRDSCKLNEIKNLDGYYLKKKSRWQLYKIGNTL